MKTRTRSQSCQSYKSALAVVPALHSVLYFQSCTACSSIQVLGYTTGNPRTEIRSFHDRKVPTDHDDHHDDDAIQDGGHLFEQPMTLEGTGFVLSRIVF